MSKALIQVVDDNDKPIYGAAKDEVWHNGLIHRVARVMIEDEQGNILLQIRDDSKWPYPGCYDPAAAGHVDEGEDYLAAVRREVKEEIGLGALRFIKVKYYWREYIYKGKTLRRFNTLYRATIPQSTPLQFAKSEVNGAKWVTKDELHTLYWQHPEKFSDGLMEAYEIMYKPHPLIQIVDENDRPLRGGTMDEVQLQGLWHRIVRIMIEDPDGNILLQLRPPDSFYDGNRWDNSVSGHVDDSEEYLTAALRELGEEAGITKSPDDLAEIASWQTERVRGGRTYRRFNRLYKLIIPRDTPFHPDPDEIAELRWFTPGEFTALIETKKDMFTGGLEYVYEHFYKL